MDKPVYDIQNKGYSAYNIDGKIFIDNYENIFKPMYFKNKCYNKYIVDIMGNVYNVKKGTRQPTRVMNNGYVVVRLSLKKRSNTWYLLHRVVASTFKDNPNNLKEVDHIDCNKQNNSAYNLDWVSDHENKIRAVNTGAFHSGFDHYESKFSKEDMDRLWDLLINSSYTFKELAKMFNVAPSIIRYIYIGKIYKKEYKNYKNLKPDKDNDWRLHKIISKDDVLHARELYNSGMSANKVYKLTGVHSYYIIRRDTDQYYSKLYDKF